MPLLEREDFRALHDAPPARRLQDGFRLVADLYAGPLHGVWAAMKEAAAGDAEVAEWCRELEERRRATLAEWLHGVA